MDRLHYRQDSRDVLEWLSPIDFAAQQTDFIRIRQPGTGKWLLKSKIFQGWVNEKNQILFCPGIPGTGKTIITSIVIKYLFDKFRRNVIEGNDDDQGGNGSQEEDTIQGESIQNEHSIGIAYVFCNFRRQDEQNAENLFASLLKQLSQEWSSLPNSVKDLYEGHKKEGMRPSFNEISRALRSVASLYSRVFIIVDALDECKVVDGCRTKFLTEIFSLLTKCAVNIFATSRFIPELTEKFNGSTILEIRASNEDVRRYLDGHMFQLPGFVVHDPLLQEDIKTGIVTAVDGMFLLAQLHLDSLIGKRAPKAIRIALKKLPTGSKAYDHAYKDAMARIEGQIGDQKELAKQVLSWIVCAKRPLTTLELRYALAVEFGELKLDEENLPQIEDMVSVCVGLVTVDEVSNIIRLVHYTTQEYFERTWLSWFPNAQNDIITSCVTYLCFDAFDSGFCLTDEDFEARLRLNPLYDYAAQNWGYHACAVSTEVEQLILDLLESEAKISSCSQAMMASRNYIGFSNYSQNVPKQITGVHLAAYFGLKEAMTALIKNGHNLDYNDTYGWTPLSWAAMNGHQTVIRLLLDNGAELESEGREGRTPLSWAAESGHEAAVKLLLEKNAEPESKDKYGGQMPPFWAAREGHGVVVKLLLAKEGVDPDPISGYGQTPLSCAAENGHEAVVKMLLATDSVDLDSKDFVYGRTPLSWAAANGHEALVKMLLENDAELESKDNRDWTPLSRAAANGYEAVVKVLLEKGGNIGSKDKNYGRTPLSWAAANGHKAVVKMLLENGAELESKDNEDRAPLSRAAASGHKAVVELLLEKDADLESRDKYGFSPLSMAAGKGQKAVMKLLLKEGAELESKDNDHRTPLSWAAANGREAVIKLLLEKGAELESKDSKGQTPLSRAAESWYKLERLFTDDGLFPSRWRLLSSAAANGREVVKPLLEGAKLELKDNEGRTPLSMVAMNRHKAVVKLLLENGAELESKDNEGRTPLSRAAERGHEVAVELLLENGAEPKFKDNEGRTPLSRATERGHKPVMRLLEKGANLT